MSCATSNLSFSSLNIKYLLTIPSNLFLVLTFVSISIITSTITFIVGLDGIFRFKKRKEIYLRRISELNNFLDYIDKNYQDKKNVKEIVIKVSEKLHELENDQIT